MKKVILICIALIFLLLMSQCSSDKNPLPSVAHPEGWVNPDAENFHGTKVLDVGYSSCKSCHGAELTGGKTGKSCFDCHSTYPHPSTWVQFEADSNHGAQIENNTVSIEDCKQCHGSDLTGGRSGISCFDCHAAGSLPL